MTRDKAVEVLRHLEISLGRAIAEAKTPAHPGVVCFAESIDDAETYRLAIFTILSG